MSVAQPPGPTPSPSSRLRRRNLVLLVSIAVVAVVLTGLYFYSVQAIGRLEITCISVSSPQVREAPEGSNATILVTFGIRNPSLLAMTASWRLILDYGNGIIFSSQASFDIPAHSTTYPRFKIVVSLPQIQRIPLNSPLPQSYAVENYRIYPYSFERRVGLATTALTMASPYQPC